MPSEYLTIFYTLKGKYMNNKELTDKQLLAIQHIISSPSFEVAAKRAHISRVSIYGWLKNDDFKAELKRQRDEVVREALDRLKCSINKATDGLVRLMDSKVESIRRFACKDVLEYGLRSIELENIEERLAKIEQMVSEGK
jgi:hypothetical protein